MQHSSQAGADIGQAGALPQLRGGDPLEDFGIEQHGKVPAVC